MVTATASGDLGTALLPSLSVGAKSGANVPINITGGGTGINFTDGVGTSVIRNTSTSVSIDAIDATITNEGILGVSAEGANSARLTTNTSTANGTVFHGNFMQTITETISSNGGAITFNAAAPYTMLELNNHTHSLTTNYTKIAMQGASVTNGDGVNLTFDNVNSEIDILSTGTYKLSFTCNCKSNTSSHLVEFDIFNTSTLAGFTGESKHYFNNTNEYCHSNMYYIAQLASGVSYGLYARTSTGTPNINDCDIRFMIERLK
jgi:hypothetical protein